MRNYTQNRKIVSNNSNRAIIMGISSMHASICSCGRTNSQPDVAVCPFCKTDLSSATEEASLKHIRKCAFMASPQIHGNRKVGRPPRKQVIVPDFLREDIPQYKRDCNNCGRIDCICKGSVCGEWSVREPNLCPFCHRPIQLVIRNGVLHSISCGYCNLHMDAYDVSRGDEALIDRWNGGLLKARGQS